MIPSRPDSVSGDSVLVALATPIAPGGPLLIGTKALAGQDFSEPDRVDSVACNRALW